MANKSVVEETLTSTKVVRGRTVQTTETRRSSSSRSERRSVSRSPSRGRSPARRKALNRSPSPHRYNTRYKQLSFDEDAQTPKRCCDIKQMLACCSGSLTKASSLLPELARCLLYVLIAYIAVTQSSYTKSAVKLPKLPKVADLFEEKQFYSSVLQWIIAAIAFTIPFGKIVSGVPTNYGTLKYLCNGKAATVFLLLVTYGVYYLDPKYLTAMLKTDHLKELFNGLLVVLIIAVIVQWKGGLGYIYSVAAGVFLLRFVDTRLSILGQPDVFYSSVVLIGAMCLTTYGLVVSVFRSPTKCAVTSASRGLLLILVTWSLTHKLYAIPEKKCFVNTSILTLIASIFIINISLIYKHRQTAKACSAVILVLALVSAVLVNKELIKIPSSVPKNSLWYVFNIGCCLDALFVMFLANWKTNFLGGFKPLNFLSEILKGHRDPRCDNFDLKFFFLRLGYICTFTYSILILVHNYAELTCAAKTVLAMTLLYSFVRAFVLEEALTSSSEIVEGHCSLSFMIWSTVVEPCLTTMPITFVTTLPEKSGGVMIYLEIAMALLFTAGIILFAASTLQGHYLLLGKDHQILSCLTTLDCDGNERLPISGLWRYVRYPFISGELMVLLAIAVSTRACCMGTGMVYLPFVIKAVSAINQVQSYISISPSFYGAESWKNYQQIVKYNIIPGIY